MAPNSGDIYVWQDYTDSQFILTLCYNTKYLIYQREIVFPAADIIRPYCDGGCPMSWTFKVLHTFVTDIRQIVIRFMANKYTWIYMFK